MTRGDSWCGLRYNKKLQKEQCSRAREQCSRLKSDAQGNSAQSKVVVLKGVGQENGQGQEAVQMC
eukprot:461523-Pelagomonas_calceolata.AAC.3